VVVVVVAESGIAAGAAVESATTVSFVVSSVFVSFLQEVSPKAITLKAMIDKVFFILIYLNSV
jgi:hypothetical protein